MRMWVQLLRVLMHVFQLPANWLDVLLYNELYPLRNDTNKYIICNNYYYFRYRQYPITLTYIAKWGLYAISGDHDNKKSKPKILQLIISSYTLQNETVYTLQCVAPIIFSTS